MPAELFPVYYISPIFDSFVSHIESLLGERFAFYSVHTSDISSLDLSSPRILMCGLPEFKLLEKRPAVELSALSCILCLEHAQQFDVAWTGLPWLAEYCVGPPEPERLAFLLNRLYSLSLTQAEMHRLSAQLAQQRHRLQDLNEIGVALSTERNLDTLMDKILKSSMEITASDSGSLYLIETRAGVEEDPKNPFANKGLRFKWTRNMSLKLDFSEFSMDINEKSIAGYVALSGEPLNIPNVYTLNQNYPFNFNQSFDQNTGYHSQSMLTVPMRNPKGEVIGILQMLNKKRDWSAPLDLTSPQALQADILVFGAEDESLLSSLASQAAVAIENARLYAAIQSLFEGFIRASVQAIESRDPTTSGHSERVAVLTVGLAEKLDRVDQGPYQNVRFSRQELKEIQYASLLHDFGKIGVRENVLVKAEKLYPDELSAIQHRFELIRKGLENDYNLRKLQYLLEMEKDKALQFFPELEEEYFRRLQKLEDNFQLILQTNRPTVLAQEASQRLQEIQHEVFSFNQQDYPLLTPFELSRLSIVKGSLDQDERLEIESHVTHTFEFLSQIPWTTELKNVPQIAYAHHEKLNGRGYPRSLNAEEIPVQSKMMTISDIYDALTASDRPYKKALPISKALDILGFEVKDGMLDAELYKIFVDSKVYELIHHSA
ncbi:HD family phosphohydrolase [bacterium (Candidatus Blackallbacteria) CG17_big_fil_post_rev_8_21_14_2_50_48_46]|uniref:HD family phosphohydrolase n=1 Tax=bacterium (Candidatus Blackallbacteria) CG17_big_fil_post_rev_8_21_14_2_50_48_46 TaxID=2014261 RepID=A0A2M7FYK3_9BACT|nr:MAG: HD family phosphohydrolase [bacterium (Candidatus Blackallbacteria) CG18_big_fil_WC_8_21_14_2_50_49_26]PIW14332.1 MAG: HD family phosphohydrolase [bacterium (Candidatus Blackallbacteria) CG17_big_fil_post_rev_8_21_14_2_50_48_46]PIW45601.1 MAG: HD family phosphohydrolase [bacterium (Candidatus Blackallbacteria) CG13_big_fil_rev_8_21_14_2_50_49_14]